MYADGAQRLSRVVFVTADRRAHDLITRTVFYETIKNWVLLTRDDKLSDQFDACVHELYFMSLLFLLLFATVLKVLRVV